jgi:hypothetical protein
MDKGHPVKRLARLHLIPALLALIVFFVLATTIARAHEWYSGKRDPIFNQTTCCGGSDCGPLPAHAISQVNGDLRVTLSLEEARRINPRRQEPFDEIIPFERIQWDAEDGSPHICLMEKNRASEGDRRQGFFCIFLSPNG